jgi:hypothetical protein
VADKCLTINEKGLCASVEIAVSPHILIPDTEVISRHDKKRRAAVDASLSVKLMPQPNRAASDVDRAADKMSCAGPGSGDRVYLQTFFKVG